VHLIGLYHEDLVDPYVLGLASAPRPTLCLLIEKQIEQERHVYDSHSFREFETPTTTLGSG
jgi:hypothetical protein